MSNNISYTYTVLRYVHDTTTGEFVNVGVAIHAPNAKYTKMTCRHTYGRLSRVFPGLQADHFKSLMRQIQHQFNELGKQLNNELPWERHDSVLEIVKRVIPTDDSTLQWSPVGVGRTLDPEATLQGLYDRMVMRYEEKILQDRRTEEDVWRHFKHTLEARNLLHYFEPRKICVEDDEIEFHHTWKNGVLHCLEAVSFDLSSSDSIRDKAHRWLGRITSIAKSSDKFRVYYLVGEPQDADLLPAFNNALSILQKTPIDNIIFKEGEVDTLTSFFAKEVALHNSQHPLN